MKRREKEDFKKVDVLMGLLKRLSSIQVLWGKIGVKFQQKRGNSGPLQQSTLFSRREIPGDLT